MYVDRGTGCVRIRGCYPATPPGLANRVVSVKLSVWIMSRAMMILSRMWPMSVRFSVNGFVAPRRQSTTVAKVNCGTVEGRFVTSLRKECGIVGGDVVIASVSGGCDSVALLHLLALARSSFVPPLLVSVLNFDHRQRGEISSCDTLFVAALARRFGLECTAHNWVHSSTHSSQMEFRAWRRTTSFKTAFNVVDALIPQRCGHVALAHHADDQMESFLLRLARGSRLTNVFKGVASQAAPCFVRPLLFATKHDLVTYLDADGESWREDTTNTDTTHYVRNLSRLTVLPPLRTLCGGSLQLHTRLKALQYQAQFFEAWVSHAADEWLSYSTRADGAVSLVTYADTPAPVRYEVWYCVCSLMRWRRNKVL